MLISVNKEAGLV